MIPAQKQKVSTIEVFNQPSSFGTPGLKRRLTFCVELSRLEKSRRARSGHTSAKTW